MSESAARVVRKHTRKEEMSRRRREMRIAQAIAAENREEQLAPAIQRSAVLAADGTVLRGPRVERLGGVSYVLSSPIKRLAARGASKDLPIITAQHVAASERLLQVWEEVGGGSIGLGCSNFGGVGGGAVSFGYIGEAIIAKLDAQTRARDEFLAVQARLGSLWPIIHHVALLGKAPSQFGAGRGWPVHTTIGFLRAALDLLCECYEPREEPKMRIRTIAPARASAQIDAVG